MQDDARTTTIQLGQGETRLITLSIDFNESPSMGIEIVFNRSHTVKLVAPIGDILNPVRFSSLDAFQVERSKLTGMNEVVSQIKLTKSASTVREKIDSIILSLANLCSNAHLRNVDSNTGCLNVFYYSGSTLKFKSLVLITIEILDQESEEMKLKSTINCEKMVLGSILSKLIKDECVKQL